MTGKEQGLQGEPVDYWSLALTPLLTHQVMGVHWYRTNPPVSFSTHSPGGVLYPFTRWRPLLTHKGGVHCYLPNPVQCCSLLYLRWSRVCKLSKRVTSKTVLACVSLSTIHLQPWICRHILLCILFIYKTFVWQCNIYLNLPFPPIHLNAATIKPQQHTKTNVMNCMNSYDIHILKYYLFKYLQFGGTSLA